ALTSAHLARMPFAVKEDEAFNPAQVGIFGTYAIVTGTNRLTDLLQELGGLMLARHTMTRNHRALLSGIGEMPSRYNIHMCTIAKIVLPRQGYQSHFPLPPFGNCRDNTLHG